MKPRVLLYDLETSYLLTKTWQIYEANAIGQGEGVVEDFQILCFAYKWLGERHTSVISQPDFKTYKKGFNDDKDVVAALWGLFNEAEVVVGHNSDQFDNRKARARMIYHDMPPHSPFQVADTKKMAKRYFGFTSNKLNDVGKYLGLGVKEDTGGYKLWDGCLAGDPKAWAKMVKYNKRDVVLTEQVYLKLLGWATQHPNMANIAERPEACPKCGVEGFLLAQGWRMTKTGKYRRYQCKSCGSYVSNRLAEFKQSSERLKYV